VIAGVGVDALANGARRITTAHRDGLNQQVRQGVKQYVRSTRKRALCFAPVHPSPVTGCEIVEPLFHDGAGQPIAYRLWAQLNEHTLTTVFHGREPLWFRRDLSAFDVGFVFTINVRCHGFQPREPDESENLAQPVKLGDCGDSGG
jgi:hypothetical protein